MEDSKPAAYGRALAVIVVGFGVPWLAVYLYYEWTNLIPLSWSWAWVQAFGWLLDTSVQWLVVIALLKLLGDKVRTVFVGSGHWLEPATMTKMFVLLVLTGLSLDYLWQLPWFELFPEKLSGLSEPSSQNFSDDETIQVGPAVLTTLLMLTAGPIIEEVFYRGLMLRKLLAAMPMGWPSPSPACYSAFIISMTRLLRHSSPRCLASFTCARDRCTPVSRCTSLTTSGLRCRSS